MAKEQLYDLPDGSTWISGAGGYVKNGQVVSTTPQYVGETTTGVTTGTTTGTQTGTTNIQTGTTTGTPTGIATGTPTGQFAPIQAGTSPSGVYQWTQQGAKVRTPEGGSIDITSREQAEQFVDIMRATKKEVVPQEDEILEYIASKGEKVTKASKESAAQALRAQKKADQTVEAVIAKFGDDKELVALVKQLLGEKGKPGVIGKFAKIAGWL